jgi:hypothetical protein
MGFWVNLRRPQSLWIFDNMLVGFNYGSNNSGDGMAGFEGTYTDIGLTTSLYNHISISDNTTALLAMGFGYNTMAGSILYEENVAASCSDGTSTDEMSCFMALGTWTPSEMGYNSYKDYTSSTVSLPNWTFAVESAMTDWATARVGVNAGYVLMGTTNAGGTAKNVTTQGGTETSFSVGLGFNYGSFNLVDVSEGLFTNPAQYVTGFAPLSEDDSARATLTYAW